MVMVEPDDPDLSDRIIRKTSNSLQPGTLAAKRAGCGLWLARLSGRGFIGAPHAFMHGANDQTDHCFSDEQRHQYGTYEYAGYRHHSCQFQHGILPSSSYSK
jgi:hypothetical protein